MAARIPHIVTEFGVDAAVRDPGSSSQFAGRGRQGSTSRFRMGRYPSPQGLKWDKMQMKKKVGLPDMPQQCRPPRRPPSPAFSRAGRWPSPRPRRPSPPPPAPSAGRRPLPHAPAAGLHRALASGRRLPSSALCAHRLLHPQGEERRKREAPSGERRLGGWGKREAHGISVRLGERQGKR